MANKLKLKLKHLFLSLDIMFYFEKLVERMSFCAFIMSQVETSEILEGMFPGSLISRGKTPLKRFDSLCKLSHRSFLEPEKQLVKFGRKRSCGGTQHVVLGCLSDWGAGSIQF